MWSCPRASLSCTVATVLDRHLMVNNQPLEVPLFDRGRKFNYKSVIADDYPLDINSVHAHTRDTVADLRGLVVI